METGTDWHRAAALWYGGDGIPIEGQNLPPLLHPTAHDNGVQQHDAWPATVLETSPVPQPHSDSFRMPPPPRPEDHAQKSQEPKQKYPDAEWDRHKATIYRLYIKEDRTQKETMDFLAKHHDFHPSCHSFKSRLAEWGFCKYLKKKTTVGVIKKARENRDRVIRLSGRPVPLAKVERIFKRHFSPSEREAVLKGQTPPNIPSFVDVSTPETAPSPLQFGGSAPSPFRRVRRDTAQPSPAQAWTPSSAALGANQRDLSDSVPNFRFGLPLSRLLELKKDCKVLLDEGNLDGAEQLLRDALCGLRHRLTTRHELTITAAYRLADFYASHERMKEADDVLNWLSQEFSEHYGLWHVRTLEHYQQVVELLQDWTRNEDAQRMAYRVFEALRDNWDRRKFVTLVAVAPEGNQPGPSLDIDDDVVDRLFAESQDPVWVDQQVRLASIWRHAGLEGVQHLLPLIAARCEQNPDKLLPQALRARCCLLELHNAEGDEDAAEREAREARNMLVTLVSRSDQQVLQGTAATLARRVAFLHLDYGDADRCQKILAWMAGKLEDCITTWVGCTLGPEKTRLTYNTLHVVVYLIQVGMEYQQRSSWVEAGPWFERAYSLAARVLGPRATIPQGLEKAIKERKYLEEDTLALDEYLSPLKANSA